MKYDHKLTYIDLHPQPIEREPGPLAVFAGAVFALFAVYLLTVFLFSL